MNSMDLLSTSGCFSWTEWISTSGKVSSWLPCSLLTCFLISWNLLIKLNMDCNAHSPSVFFNSLDQLIKIDTNYINNSYQLRMYCSGHGQYGHWLHLQKYLGWNHYHYYHYWEFADCASSSQSSLVLISPNLFHTQSSSLLKSFLLLAWISLW